MKKSKLLYFMTIICIFILSSCNNTNRIGQKEIIYVNGSSSWSGFPEKFSDFFSESYATTVIIKGHPMSSSINHLYGKTDGPGMNLGVTITEISVTEVIKGDIEAGSEIQILEFYFYNEDEEKITYYFFDNYAPSQINKEYIFILQPTTEEYGKDIFPEAYWVLFGAIGRYPALANKDIVSNKPKIQKTYSANDRVISIIEQGISIDGRKEVRSVNKFSDAELDILGDNNGLFYRFYEECIEYLY